MKLATYLSEHGPAICVVRETATSSPEDISTYEYVAIAELEPSLPTSLVELLQADESVLKKVQALSENATPLNETPTLLSVIPNARKLLCVGLNYADHAKETGAKVGEEPVIFNKLPTTLLSYNGEIELPSVSDAVDFEAELVVVIGKGGKNIPAESSFNHVAGYTCGNDVSARDWQKGKPGKQWLLGKSFDTFAPVGPFLVTPDEVGNPEDLQIQLRLNGELMQDSRTSQLIFKIGYLISYLSQVFTLEPGDLIFTGTPSGVGFARDPQVLLKAGDVVEVSIENIGVLRNSVVAGR